MKSFRILTGTHAGIQSSISPGEQSIGSGEDTDICITDWSGPDVIVQLDDAGTLSVRATEETPPSYHGVGIEPVLVPDFVPFRFGDIVVCFGADDAPWPSDLELLASMYNGTPKPAPAVASSLVIGARHHTRAAALTATMLLALCLGVGALLSSRASQASSVAYAPLSPQMLTNNLNSALQDAGLHGLHASLEGNSVTVSGMAQDAAQDIATRTLLDRMADPRIARRYDVATTDATNLADALGIDGLHVSYQGDGTFRVTGTVPSMTQFKDSLNRVRPDLDTNIKRIESSVTEAPSMIGTIAYSEMMDVGGVRYVETPDGIKHLLTTASQSQQD
jgi:type III secretion protein D